MDVDPPNRPDTESDPLAAIGDQLRAYDAHLDAEKALIAPLLRAVDQAETSLRRAGPRGPQRSRTAGGAQ